MHTKLPHALRLLAAAALPLPLPAALRTIGPAARLVAFSAALLAPPPVRAQIQHEDVCALVACSASGQRAATFTDPARTQPGAQRTASPSRTTLASAPKDRPAPAAAPRDPWARRFQGRETEDEDACLLNFGLDGQLARKGTLGTHVLGRTQAWRGPAR